jgi:hypothetical protein
MLRKSAVFVSVHAWRCALLWVLTNACRGFFVQRHGTQFYSPASAQVAFSPEMCPQIRTWLLWHARNMVCFGRDDKI